jgi:hypothetical protein
MRGRPTVLATGDVNEIIDMVLNAQITHRPFSGPEARGIIEKKYQKTVLLDTVCSILGRNGRVFLCTAVLMKESQLQVPEQA